MGRPKGSLNIKDRGKPYLRKCRQCGLEAKTKDDLDSFISMKKSYYGKDNLCRDCFNENNRFGGKYWNRIKAYEKTYLPKRMKFKDKLIIPKRNARSNICSNCGKRHPEELSHQTCLHHEKYDKDHPLQNTIELCQSCHMKLHNKRGDVFRLEGTKRIPPKSKVIA